MKNAVSLMTHRAKICLMNGVSSNTISLARSQETFQQIDDLMFNLECISTLFQPSFLLLSALPNRNFVFSFLYCNHMLTLTPRCIADISFPDPETESQHGHKIYWHQRQNEAIDLLGVLSFPKGTDGITICLDVLLPKRRLCSKVFFTPAFHHKVNSRWKWAVKL